MLSCVEKVRSFPLRLVNPRLFRHDEGVTLTSRLTPALLFILDCCRSSDGLSSDRAHDDRSTTDRRPRSEEEEGSVWCSREGQSSLDNSMPQPPERIEVLTTFFGISHRARNTDALPFSSPFSPSRRLWIDSTKLFTTPSSATSPSPP